MKSSDGYAPSIMPNTLHALIYLTFSAAFRVAVIVTPILQINWLIDKDTDYQKKIR